MLEPPHEATRSSAGWWASKEVLEMIKACRHGLHQNVEELKACRHGLHQNVEALRGRAVKLYQGNQAPSVERCAKCHPNAQHSWPRSRTSYLAWIHENKIRLDVVYIRSEANFVRCAIAPTGSRHVVLAAAHAARALALGRVDIGLASLPSLASRVQWLQDSPLRFTVVTAQPSTVCSSIGHRPLHCG
jgi:hypothetical protein